MPEALPDPLGRLKVASLSGAEAFRIGDRDAEFNVLDFWRWSTSDLVSNATRGVLAEYIVAKALGVPTGQPRVEWAAFDLLTPDGLGVEVKSAAYVQTWGQTSLSNIVFGIHEGFGWDPETNVTQTTRSRPAHVYVFALLFHPDKATVNPLNLAQWQFWVVKTSLLNARFSSQKSIALSSLRKLAGEPATFEGLRKAVAQACAEEP